MKKVTKNLNLEQSDDGWWVASTPSVDRDGDIVEPLGVDLTNWLKAGAPLIFGHDYRAFWSTIGKAEDARVSQKSLEIKPRWRDAVNDADPMNIIRYLIDDGYIKQLSIGFVPLSWEDIPTGRKFTNVELLEVSVVNVAANQEALRLAVKGFSEKKEDSNWGKEEPKEAESITETQEQETEVETEIEPVKDAEEPTELFPLENWLAEHGEELLSILNEVKNEYD